jgi:hypothetical protein
MQGFSMHQDADRPAPAVRVRERFRPMAGVHRLLWPSSSSNLKVLFPHPQFTWNSASRVNSIGLDAHDQHFSRPSGIVVADLVPRTEKADREVDTQIG